MVQPATVVHPGPMNVTIADPGSRFVPLMVKVKNCPATGGLGDVVIVLMRAPMILSVSPPDGVPAKPFWTLTLKTPSPNVAVPLNCVELLLHSALLRTMHFADSGQPGPVMTTMADPGSKPVPRTVKSNGLPLTGAAGDVKMVVAAGTPKATVNGKVLDDTSDPFLTVTEYLPPDNRIEPRTCVELFDKLTFATTHDVRQPGPLKTTRTVEESKFAPLTKKVKVCPSMGAAGVVIIELI